MTFIYLFGALLLGLLVGAYANARVMRRKDALTFTTGRACAVCATPANPKEYLPIIGYLAVKGRCHKCAAVIPWQYPVTEVVFGLMFVIFAARALGLWGLAVPGFVTEQEVILLFARDALIASALILIFLFDYLAFIIPDRLTIPAMIVALVCNLFLGFPVISSLLGGFLIGGFFALQYLVSGGRWVGGGDIRMGLLIGFLLGPVLGVETLLISYILGAILGVYLLVTKQRAMESHVPFGTFLALGTFVTMLWGENLLNWYLGLFS